MLEMNYDCFRDVLQYLKDNLYMEEVDYNPHPVFHEIGMNTIYNDSVINSKYSKEEYTYTIIKLLEVGYIEHQDIKKDSKGNIIFLTIKDITERGFEFLDIANQNNVWNKVKGGFKKFGGFSLDVLKQVTPLLIAELVKSAITP